ncbi:MAG: hypothetical protein SF187_04065 [Deltaproteobacteria bacterium]|nr:hypothetical protein [Deltaproteobacteria bacterium]
MTTARETDCERLARKPHRDWVAFDESRRNSEASWRSAPSRLPIDVGAWTEPHNKRIDEAASLINFFERDGSEINDELCPRIAYRVDATPRINPAHPDPSEEGLLSEIFKDLLSPLQLTRFVERLDQLSTDQQGLQIAAFAACLNRIVQRPFDQSSEIAEFLGNVNRVCQSDVDAALDMVYETLDRWMRESKFGLINAVFDALMQKKLDLLIAIGFLVASLPARDRVASREPFLERVRRQALETRTASEVDELMSGL